MSNSSLCCQKNKLKSLDISNDYDIKAYINDNGAYFYFYFNEIIVSSFIHNLKDIVSITIYKPKNIIHKEPTKHIVEQYMSNRP